MDKECQAHEGSHCLTRGSERAVVMLVSLTKLRDRVFEVVLLSYITLDISQKILRLSPSSVCRKETDMHSD